MKILINAFSYAGLYNKSQQRQFESLINQIFDKQNKANTMRTFENVDEICFKYVAQINVEI